MLLAAAGTAARLSRARLRRSAARSWNCCCCCCCWRYQRTEVSLLRLLGLLHCVQSRRLCKSSCVHLSAAKSTESMKLLLLERFRLIDLSAVSPAERET